MIPFHVMDSTRRARRIAEWFLGFSPYGAEEKNKGRVKIYYLEDLGVGSRTLVCNWFMLRLVVGRFTNNYERYASSNRWEGGVTHTNGVDAWRRAEGGQGAA